MKSFRERAIEKYPDLPPDEAHRRFVFEYNQASTESQGLGDTVAKVARAVGADRLAGAYTRLTGRDCGCKGRQEALNRLFPYGKP